MNIYVGGIPFGMTPENLKEIFSRYGKVIRAEIPKHPYTDRQKGFAFVEMPDENEAKSAVDALNNSVLENRHLSVNEAQEKKPKLNKHPFRGEKPTILPEE
ncbi:MAG: RNA-binding protein [Bacteroidales bacterium]|jgi:RNA recognition motif-containing protein|nr:RNA-binding protein [Bacteroidales bacterium]